MFAFMATVVIPLVAEPVFSVDSSYGLTINVMGIPPHIDCTITWQRADGLGPKVSQRFAANASIRLLRFTPKKEYNFQVKDAAGHNIGSKDFYTCTAGKTGVAQYDADKPFVNINGHASFEMMVVDHGSDVVGFNADGWIVWHVPGVNGAWDQLPAEVNYNIVTLSGRNSLFSFGLKEVRSSGKQVANVSISGLSHEARVDRQNSDFVLSVGSETRSISSLKNPIKGDKIVRWDRKRGTVETLYNLFDFYNPVTDYGQCSGRNNTSACRPPHLESYDSYSQGSFQRQLEDWTHANSVERGTRNNYIMSVRHLSSVISFHADGSGIQWVLSGEGVKPSKAPSAVVLKYGSDGEQQYLEHCARQLDNGNVIMFDNGDLRQPPFSRFSEYAIDVERGTAKLVWQFHPMLDNATSGEKMFAFHAGSVQRLRNGNTVGALSCDNSRVGVNCTHVVFEANSKGSEVARTVVPQPKTGGFGYRGTALSTLGGEHEVRTTAWQLVV